jgi:hypothetical protein
MPRSRRPREIPVIRWIESCCCGHPVEVERHIAEFEQVVSRQRHVIETKHVADRDRLRVELMKLTRPGRSSSRGA